jgi:3-oxoacyl-[acyl-carrier-protein] synthase II
MSDIVVTGLGVVLPGADTKEEFWAHLRNQRSQLSIEEHPAIEGGRCAVGRVRDFDPARYLHEVPYRYWRSYPRELLLYLSSLMNARQDGDLDLSQVDPTRVGLFDGVARPALGFWYERIRAEALDSDAPPWTRKDLKVALPGQSVGIAAALLGVRGPVYTYTSTCSSGAVAIGHALRELESGRIDVAFAGGHEAPLIEPLFAMYGDAGLISAETGDPQRAVRPFVDHSANAFGEGAVTMVLEREEHARARCARILARLDGYSYGNNGYHPTSVDVMGVRPTEVLERLIDEARIEPDDVAFVVGHGNGVRRSDVSEQNYMRRLFAEQAASRPLLSVKPIYGHSLGCSSATNAAAVVMMLHNDEIVGTANIDRERAKTGVCHWPDADNLQPQGAGIAMSYGMGGQNAALMFSRGELSDSAHLRRTG